MKALAFEGSNRTIVDNSPFHTASDFGKTQKNLVKYGKSIHQRNAAAHPPNGAGCPNKKCHWSAWKGKCLLLTAPFIERADARG